MNCKSVLIMSLIAVSLGSSMVQAAIATNTFPVTATVLPSCKVSASALAFGEYSQSTALPVDSSNLVTVTCTIGTAYDIGLDGGGGGDVASRRMTSGGANVLTYALFKDSAHTANWGNTKQVDTFPGTTTVDTVPVGTNIHTVYGRISSGQNVSAGAYTDTVTVTVYY